MFHKVRDGLNFFFLLLFCCPAAGSHPVFLEAALRTERKFRLSKRGTEAFILQRVGCPTACRRSGYDHHICRERVSIAS